MKYLISALVLGMILNLSPKAQASVYSEYALKQLEKIPEANMKTPRDLANLRAAKENLSIETRIPLTKQDPSKDYNGRICTIEHSFLSFVVLIDGLEVFTSSNRGPSTRYVNQLVLNGTCVYQRSN